MDGKGLGGTTLTHLSFLKQSLTPAIDGSPYDDKMEVSAPPTPPLTFNHKGVL